MREQIEKCCKKLRLGSIIVERYLEIKSETNEEFLAKLLEIALEEREMNRKNRLLKQANFDVMKTFENYSFDSIEMPSTIDVENLKAAKFVEAKENLILYGGVGTGKTHLAMAIGVSACNNSKRVKFYRTAELVNELIEAKKSGELNKYMKKLEKIDLLICDEWGYIPFDTQGAQLLFQVIANCYEKRSVIITTNIEFGKWNGIFYDEKLTSAIIDRLVHHSHLLMFTGRSYRMSNSLLKA